MYLLIYYYYLGETSIQVKFLLHCDKGRFHLHIPSLVGSLFNFHFHRKQKRDSISIKVNIFWEGRKILWNLHHRFVLCLSNLRWRFHKILWPSQNILTLQLQSVWGKFSDAFIKFKKILFFFRFSRKYLAALYPFWHTFCKESFRCAIRFSWEVNKGQGIRVNLVLRDCSS